MNWRALIKFTLGMPIILIFTAGLVILCIIPAPMVAVFNLWNIYYEKDIYGNESGVFCVIRSLWSIP